MIPGRKIHYTELPPSQPGDPLELEGSTYRQEVGRLLGEGLEGKYVLIKGSSIIGVYDTEEEAMDEGRRRYLVPRQPFLVHQIQTWERILRTRN